ncbi:hypothetical protein SAMN02745673_01462 [Marinactinospora thermotolerans DSM 45154]|uniref:Uncharacterized protein n=1 Tax=Marinactinospora thermotolerans DSM 45154 TaxID=1122192 RepID=A0A1T4NIA3_9ACTN|nr:hypothetical protein SAMN02745673_01462 [Marinactinospora thermotolerans DSM 45154]
MEPPSRGPARPCADQLAGMPGRPPALTTRLLQDAFPAWVIHRDGVSWCARGPGQSLTAPTLERLRAMLEETAR